MKRLFVELLVLICVACASYGIGNMQGKTEIPEGYVKLEECIPLEDISSKFTNGYDYLCVEIRDVTRQLDNHDNYSYEDVLYGIEDITEELKEDNINMNNVIGFDATETGLMLYTSDGSGYYWESEGNVNE